jgi:protein kinase C substrate 80K-H
MDYGFDSVGDVQGDGCWQGPSRHLMVNMSCGERTEVLAVEEPSRCSYAATLTSPALCTPDVILGVKQEIADFFDTSRGHTSENGAPQEQL